MSCPKCGGSGWVIVFRRNLEAADRCPCKTVQQTAAAAAGEALTENVATAVVDALCDALDDAPRKTLGKALVVDALMSMCATADDAWWVARRATVLYTRWCGVPGLRQILCARSVPKDGLEVSYSEAYPEGIPSERPALQEALPLLGPGKVSGDAQIDTAVQRAAEATQLPAPDKPFPIRTVSNQLSTRKPITRADIEQEEQRLREEKERRLNEAAQREIHPEAS